MRHANLLVGAYDEAAEVQYKATQRLNTLKLNTSIIFHFLKQRRRDQYKGKVQHSSLFQASHQNPHGACKGYANAL